jgi:hypothetical protein
MLDKFIFAASAAFFGGVAGVMQWRVVSYHASNLVKPAWFCVGLAILFLVGFLLRQSRLQRLLRSFAITILNTAVILGAIEFGGRLVGVDYNAVLRLKEKNERFPVYFRQPSREVGEIYFTREGPMEWKGRALKTLGEIYRSNDNAYADEEEVTISYSSEGFRNPETLKDWQLAIVGDSFTESGYLPAEEIFPTLTGKALGLTVKNLGISDTGTYSHCFYLKNFGRAPSCKQAVVAFFEGNDVNDNAREREELQKFRTEGIRPSHEIGREPSLIRTIYHIVRDSGKVSFRSRSFANATFIVGGKKHPVTIADAPPSPEEMTAEEKTALSEGIALWASTCREAGVEPWLLYIPCKRRVYDGHLEQGANYPKPEWKLNSLPQLVAAECARQNISIVDATQALTEAATNGVMTYNAICDTHLNREGHRIVAQVLAEGLSKPAPVGKSPEVTAAGPAR